MKLTKRELILLVFLLLIGLSFVEYRFIVAPGFDKYWQLTERNEQLDAEISSIQLDLQSSVKAKDERDDFVRQIQDVQSRFLGPLQSSRLFYYSYDLMTRNQFLPGSYSITPVTLNLPNPDKIILEKINYKLSDMVEQYEQIRKVEELQTDSQENSDADTESQILSELELLEMLITGTGQYEQIKTLLSDIKAQNKTFVVSYLNLTPVNADMIGFEIRLQYYGVKKFEQTEDNFNTWIRPPFDGGIENPFYQDFPENQITDELTDEDELVETEETTLG